LVTADNADAFAEIPVHIDFVTNYGLDDSHLTAEGIAQFKEWRPEYADADFVFADGSDRFVTKSEVGKMSKSKFNVINPDDVIERYGSDCFRMYEMFLGPIEQAKPWDIQGIDGVSKFLRRFYDLFFDEADSFTLSDAEPTKEEMKVLHSAIKKVTDDIERFSFNTCVAAFMVATNDLRKLKCNKKAVLKEMVILLAPFAPHVAEELWHQMGGEGSVHHTSYPVFDEKYLKEDSISYPISINGKKRAMADFSAEATKEEIEKAALELEDIKKWTDGKEVKRVIVVPKRMVNIVVK
jgi:leucyl-tRNA synthetase